MASVFWLFGYLKTRFGLPSDGTLVFIPKWMNLLVCGFPQSNDLPKDSVLTVGLRAQLIGWLLLVYTLFAKDLINDELLTFIIGFLGSFLVSKALVSLVDGKGHADS